MKVSTAYNLAADAKLVYRPDSAALARARRNHKRNLAEPGDCAGNATLLMGLAIAQAQIGMRPGWIPEVQKLGCEIASVLESQSLQVRQT